MSNKTYITGNALLWMLIQIYLGRGKSSLIKDIYPVSNSSHIEEKVCIKYINGDIIEFTVNDEDASVCATLILQQRETNSNRLIKGKLIDLIPKWTDEFGESQISASYLAKLTYFIKRVQADYESGNFARIARIMNTTLSE
jgi:hypothetical protein